MVSFMGNGCRKFGYIRIRFVLKYPLFIGSIRKGFLLIKKLFIQHRIIPYHFVYKVSNKILNIQISSAVKCTLINIFITYT